jgi:hypothetical protein
MTAVSRSGSAAGAPFGHARDASVSASFGEGAVVQSKAMTKSLWPPAARLEFPDMDYPTFYVS